MKWTRHLGLTSPNDKKITELNEETSVNCQKINCHSIAALNLWKRIKIDD